MQGCEDSWANILVWDNTPFPPAFQQPFHTGRSICVAGTSTAGGCRPPCPRGSAAGRVCNPMRKCNGEQDTESPGDSVQFLSPLPTFLSPVAQL